MNKVHSGATKLTTFKELNFPIEKNDMKTTLIISSGGDMTIEYNYLERL